jgi:hypothetical protein
MLDIAILPVFGVKFYLGDDTTSGLNSHRYNAGPKASGGTMGKRIRGLRSPYFRPSFFPAASRRIASRMRFSRVSGRFAV